MKDRPAGSYIAGEKGNLTPNLEDPAMKARADAESGAETKKEPKGKEGKKDG